MSKTHRYYWRTCNNLNNSRSTIMKRILSLFFLCGMIISAYAQKSYVTVYCRLNQDNTIILSGDIPSNMKRGYYPADFGDVRAYDCIGDVLNLLAKNGFTVEQMNTTVYEISSANVITTYLLSKPTDPSNAIQRVYDDTDENVTEVARYNLQGIPISENEKGIQIVVYSNYTTKTIIVE